MEETACRTIVAERGQRHTRLGTVRKLHRCLVAAHRGFHPARMRGIDLDLGIAELVGKVDGKGVECRFRCIIRERLGVVDWGTWDQHGS